MQPITRRELAWALGLIVAGVAVQLTISGAWSLFRAQFWVDELFTVYGATIEPRLFAQYFTAPVETNMPMLHLLLGGWAAVFGASELSFRAFSFGCVALALLATYAYARLCVGRLAAATGVAVLWAHPIVIREAFDARYYAPWLLLGALFLLAIARQWRTVPLIAILLCSIHFFGVITWAAIVGGYLMIRHHVPRGAWAGLATLLVAVPLAVVQRRGLMRTTWIDPMPITAFPGAVATFLGTDLLWVAFGLAIGLSLCKPRHGGSSTALLPGLMLAPALIGALALLSLFQPAFVERYLTVGAISCGLVAAVITAQQPSRLLAAVVMLTVVVFGTDRLQNLAAATRERDRQVNAMLDTLTASPAPIAFETLHDALVFTYYRPELLARARLVRGPDVWFGFELARHLEKLHPIPGTATWDDLRGVDELMFVAARGGGQVPGELVAVERHDRVVRLRRRPDAESVSPRDDARGPTR